MPRLSSQLHTYNNNNNNEILNIKEQDNNECKYTDTFFYDVVHVPLLL